MARMGSTSFPRIRIGIGAGRYIYLPVLTTTQRNLLSPSAGWLIYNSTTTQVESYNGSAWVAVGTVYADATFLKLAGGTMSGNIAMAGAQTVDGVDISVHAADLDAHTRNPYQIVQTGAGVYYPLQFITTNTMVFVADRLYAVPLLVPRAMSFDQIVTMIKTAVAGKIIRMGLYNDGTNLYPGTLVQDFGTVSTTSAAVVSITLSPVLSLAKGLYWLVSISNDVPANYQLSAVAGVLGVSASNLTLPNVGYSKVDPSPGTWSAALPATYPSDGGLVVSVLPTPYLRPYSMD